MFLTSQQGRLFPFLVRCENFVLYPTQYYLKRLLRADPCCRSVIKEFAHAFSCAYIELWMHLESLESTQMLALLSAALRATLTHFSCSPNFPLASITRYTHAKHEQILNFPNQNSPLASTIMFSIDKYMYEKNQMIKGKNKTKTKKN